MKYEFVIGAALLLLLAGCALLQTQQPQGAVVVNTNEASYDAVVDTPKEECVMKKHPRVDVYDCFGCSNNNCREAPTGWREVGQDIPRIKCLASPRGCVVA